MNKRTSGKLIISKNCDMYSTYHKLNIIQMNGNCNILNIKHKTQKLMINGNNNNIIIHPSGKVDHIILNGNFNKIISNTPQISNISDFGSNNKEFFEENNSEKRDDDIEVIDTLPERFLLNWENDDISSNNEENEENVNDNNMNNEIQRNEIFEIVNNIYSLIESTNIATNLIKAYINNNTNINNINLYLIDVSFKNQENNKDREKCAICLVNFIENEQIKMTSCFHLFHFQCIKKWIEEKLSSPDCPICRNKL